MNDGKDLPKKLLNEWMILFVNAQPVNHQYNPELRQDSINTTIYESPSGSELTAQELDKVPNGIRLLDEKEFADYLGGRGDWAYPSEV